MIKNNLNMGVFYNNDLEVVHWPHQKVGELEKAMIRAGYIEEDLLSAGEIRDYARNFLFENLENDSFLETVGLSLDKFKEYFRVAECYANKSRENPAGHFDLKQRTLFTSVCGYCGTHEIDKEDSIYAFD